MPRPGKGYEAIDGGLFNEKIASSKPTVSPAYSTGFRRPSPRISGDFKEIRPNAKQIQSLMRPE